MSQKKRNLLLWGDEARTKTAELYYVRAINHLKLLPGQRVFGECGDLTERCYVLELCRKETGLKKIYNVGYRVAEDLLDKTGQPYLPVFDLLKSENGGSGREGRGRGRGVSNVERLSPLNREFFNAINIVLIAWKVEEPGDLFKDCLAYLNSCPGLDTKEGFILKFNSAISKDGKQRTLTQMLEDVRKEYGDVRNFTFPLMHAILGDKSRMQ